MADDASQGTAVPSESATETAQTEVETSTPAPSGGEATEVTAKVEETGNTDGTSGDDSAEPEQPKRNGFQERISQLTQRAKEAEAREREAAERLAMYEQRAMEAQQAQSPRPTLEQFDYDQSAYETALAAYITEQNTRGIQSAFAENERLEAERARQAANQAATEAFRARADAFAEEHTDFTQVVNGSPVLAQSGEAIQQAVLLSENGPALAYHLAQNPQAAMEINQMPPGMAMMQLGIISQQLATPPPVVTTRTPAPAEPVAPSGSIEKDPDKMSPDEYARWRGYK